MTIIRRPDGTPFYDTEYGLLMRGSPRYAAAVAQRGEHMTPEVIKPFPIIAVGVIFDVVTNEYVCERCLTRWAYQGENTPTRCPECSAKVTYE